MKPTEQLLVDFFFEQIEQQPIARRIVLLRAFGCETRRPEVADACRKMADELEEIEARHRQLRLQFNSQHATGRAEG